MERSLNQMYVDNLSFFNKLDPKVKIIIIFIYIITLIFVNNFFTLFLAYGFSFILLKLSKAFNKKMILFLKTLIPAILSIYLINIYVLNKDLFEVLKTLSILILSMISIGCFVQSTKVESIARAIEALIPFKKILPAYELSIMFTIALRFLPIILKEFERIKKAKICRGIYIEDLKLLEKFKYISSFFIPLFLLSLEKAYNLSIAMEIKGYRKIIRKTKWNFNKNNRYICVILLIYLILLTGGNL